MTQAQWTSSGTYTWQVPPGVTSIAVDLTGACKNASTTRAPQPGRVTGTLTVTPGEILTIVVGGMGGSPSGATGGAAGYNGGGSGGTSSAGFTGGDGGSGATDLRQGGTGLANRKAVAGGAGGCAGNGEDGGFGGAPPITNGQGLGSFGGFPGTASAGGAVGRAGGSATAGALGQGGHGGDQGAAGENGSGGGGGGYYGGGGGGNGGSPTVASGGGGGSNYTGGLSGTITSVTQNGAFGSGAVTITYNVPPNAPVLNSPSSGSDIDQTIPTTFTWQFSDPDPGDTQQSADMRWRIASGAWNTITGFSGSALQSAVTAANFFAPESGVTVEWQMRTTDNHGLVGPWSTSSFFTPRLPPPAPTITPTPSITSNVVQVHVTGSGFQQVQARVVNDVAGAPGSTVLVDSGIGGGISPTQTSWTQTLPAYPYVAGTTYHVQARVGMPPGVQSPWTDSGPIICTIGAAPLAPTASVSADPTTASVAVQITNPGSDPNPPDHNDVYRTDLTNNTPEIRIATQVPVNGRYVDYLASANVNLRYRVVAVTAAGGAASSP